MNQNVIDMLNQGRARELVAVTQYMTQHYEMEDQMYGQLADHLKKVGIQEMRHAEAFAERILFLGGVPVTRPDEPIKKKQAIADLVQTDIGLEEDAVRMYNDFARRCADEGDHVSKALFEQLAKEEEDHLNDFQNILAHVQNLGPAYLARLAGEAEG